MLVHGWMVTARMWDGFAPLLPAARPITPGLAIAGAAPPSAAEAAAVTLETLAADVLVAATAAGAERFDLIGHSMGGQLAQLVAATAPARVRSLTLVNPVPLAGLPLPAEVAAAFRGSGGDRAAQAAILSQACRELTAAATDALLDDAGTIAPGWIARGFDLFTAGIDGARLEAITCPTLVVATDDPFLPPPFLEDAIVSRVRGARLAVLNGPGHYPHLERPAELARLVARFLAEAGR